MDFDLIVAENCSACERAENKLLKYAVDKDFIKFKTFLQEVSPFKTTIVPSLFINGKLFAYGEIDAKLLEKKVFKLHRKEVISII